MKQRIIITLKEGLDEFLEFRWNLSQDLLVVLIVYLLLISTLYITFQIVTLNKLFPNFILFGLSLILIEVFIPIIYHRVIKDRPLYQMGITKKYWLISLIIGFICGLISILLFLKLFNISPIDNLPLLIISLTVGLSDTIFFRGWMQLRLDDAFGAIPTIFIGAVLYGLYHIVYGLNSYEILIFFIIGIIFALLFRLTRNILILWPFFSWSGSFYKLIGQGFIFPEWTIYGFLLIIAINLLFIRLIMNYYRN